MTIKKDRETADSLAGNRKEFCISVHELKIYNDSLCPSHPSEFMHGEKAVRSLLLKPSLCFPFWAEFIFAAQR